MWQEDLKIGQNYPLKIESVSLVFTCLNNWQIVIENKIHGTKVIFQHLSLVALFRSVSLVASLKRTDDLLRG